jgi:hypothetical protein
MKIAVLLLVFGVPITLILAEGLGLVVGLFVTLVLSGGLGFTLREFKRLSTESEAHNHAAGKILDFRNAQVQRPSGIFLPRKRFSESAVYGQSRAASELH